VYFCIHGRYSAIDVRVAWTMQQLNQRPEAQEYQEQALFSADAFVGADTLLYMRRLSSKNMMVIRI
jgi:hypothetical protein